MPFASMLRARRHRFRRRSDSGSHPVTGRKSKRESAWVEVIARVAERLVPDALTTAIFLMVILAVLALLLGEPAARVIDAYYNGLWDLLAFTMQMTLVLVLSLVIAASPFFRTLVVMVSRIPKTTTQVIVIATLFTGFLAYLNWGLALALGPMVGVHFAKEAERKGIPIDFLWLLAILAGAGAVWQFGLSASAPLMMTSETNFLVDEVGVMSLSTTIFTPASIAMVVGFLVLTVIAGRTFMPKNCRPISHFAESDKLAETAATSPEPIEPSDDMTLAQRMEHSSWTIVPLVFGLIAWLYQHFFVLDRELDINAMNTIFLLVGFALHGNIARYTGALQDVIKSAWPVILLYHLYAGVAGLIQNTDIGIWIASLIEPIANRYSFPFLTVLISTIVATFIPTSGGQWVIQGFITVRTALAAGVTPQRGLLALSVGDHMGNLITPFWAVVSAGIARVGFRQLYGYRLIFAAIWFVYGVAVFTFLPC
jgi:short-chain fatty acids transporter